MGSAYYKAIYVVFSAGILLLVEGFQVKDFSLNTIAAKLNASNTPTMRGVSWTAKAVSRVIDASTQNEV